MANLTPMEKGTIALVDDHAMLRHGLAMLVDSIGYTVLFEAGNGLDMIKQIESGKVPQVVLMDINMPEMDGYEATVWLKEHYPSVHVVTLTMYEDDTTIIRMLKCGSRGYIMKESEPQELQEALSNVIKFGVHYTPKVSGKLLHALATENSPGQMKKPYEINGRELEFLKLACTEMTYKEIAQAMHLSPRTIDGYRDNLFEKLNAKNRVGLVLYALKQNLIHLY